MRFSEVLFNENKKDEAAFWYHAGLLRCQYDANRCADVSAREGVGVLAMKYGPAITGYVLQDPAKWNTLITEVVEWDRKTAHNYDCRWINLHGMNAVMASVAGDQRTGEVPAMSLPKAKWEDIAEKTRKDFQKTFHEIIEQVKSNPDGGSLNKILEQLKTNDGDDSLQKALEQPKPNGDKVD